LLLGFVFLVVLGATAYFSYSKPDVYIVRAEIITPEAKSSFPDLGLGSFPQGFSFYKGVFESRSFYSQIIEAVDKKKLKPFSEDTSLFGLEQFIGRSVLIEPGRSRGFYQIRSRATQDSLAFILAQKATDLFIERCARVVSSETESELNEIELNMELFRERLEKATVEYQAYLEKEGLLSAELDDELKQLKQNLFSLKSKKTQQRADYQSHSNQLKKLEAQALPKKKKVGPDYKKNKKPIG